MDITAHLLLLTFVHIQSLECALQCVLAVFHEMCLKLQDTSS
jgi:hypothetical protein